MAHSLSYARPIGFQVARPLLASVAIFGASLFCMVGVIGICHGDPGYFSGDWETGSAILGIIYGVCLAGIWGGTFFTISTLKDTYFS